MTERINDHEWRKRGLSTPADISTFQPEDVAQVTMHSTLMWSPPEMTRKSLRMLEGQVLQRLKRQLRYEAVVGFALIKANSELVENLAK